MVLDINTDHYRREYADLTGVLNLVQILEDISAAFEIVRAEGRPEQDLAFLEDLAQQISQVLKIMDESLERAAEKMPHMYTDIRKGFDDISAIVAITLRAAAVKANPKFN